MCFTWAVVAQGWPLPQTPRQGWGQQTPAPPPVPLHGLGDPCEAARHKTLSLGKRVWWCGPPFCPNCTCLGGMSGHIYVCPSLPKPRGRAGGCSGGGASGRRKGDAGPQAGVSRPLLRAEPSWTHLCQLHQTVFRYLLVFYMYRAIIWSPWSVRLLIFACILQVLINYPISGIGQMTDIRLYFTSVEQLSDPLDRSDDWYLLVF